MIVSRTRNSGRRFAGFGAFGETPLFPSDPTLKFLNDDAANDVLVMGINDMHDGGGPLSPIPSGVVRLASQRWADMQNGYDAATVNAVSNYGSKLKGLLRSLDALQKFGWGGRSPAQDAQYRSTVADLKQTLVDVGNYNASVGAIVGNVVSGNTPTANLPGTLLDKLTAMVGFPSASAATPSAYPANYRPTEESTVFGIPTMYVVGGAAALLVGGYLFSRKRK